MRFKFNIWSCRYCEFYEELKPKEEMYGHCRKHGVKVDNQDKCPKWKFDGKEGEE